MPEEAEEAMGFEEWIELAGKVVDAAGVIVIVGGMLAVTLYLFARDRAGHDVGYHDYRQGVGRAILLGLEILVAADIIRSVAVRPTFTSVGVLALIVIIRTILSFSIEVELEGRWPWQGRRPRSDTSAR
jgi:uncharacterized membrane protein